MPNVSAYALPGEGMGVTLKDVAREARMSTATVSRVINGHGDVSQATRQRILGVAERLRYVPNSGARSLSTGLTHTLPRRRRAPSGRSKGRAVFLAEHSVAAAIEAPDVTAASTETVPAELVVLESCGARRTPRLQQSPIRSGRAS